MPSYPFFPFSPIKKSGARLDITQPDWPRLQIDFAKPDRHLIKQLLIKPDVPCPSSWACFLWQSLHALAMHACKCANCFVSCRLGIPSQNPRGGAGHSLIWSTICAAEQHLVLGVLRIKHVIQFHYLASSTREVILEKKPLKECNGSREALYIQTRYYFVSFAKKYTNKQTERTLTGTPQLMWPITAGQDTCIKKQEILKNTAI